MLPEKLTFAVLAILMLTAPIPRADDSGAALAENQVIELPPPAVQGSLSLEEAIARRVSVRSFQDRELTWEQIGQLLWVAQGMNRLGTRYRTVPSAGALYPLEIYAVVPDGVYHYLPGNHTAVRIQEGDARKTLSDAGLKQDSIREAGCVFVICAVFERTQSQVRRARRAVCYFRDRSRRPEPPATRIADGDRRCSDRGLRRRGCPDSSRHSRGGSSRSISSRLGFQR